MTYLLAVDAKLKNLINKKIENNEANIYTAEEFKKLIKEDNAPDFE